MSDTLRERVEALREALRQCVDALTWCAGSDDFAPTGRSRAGWENVALPALAAGYGALDYPKPAALASSASEPTTDEGERIALACDSCLGSIYPHDLDGYTCQGCGQVVCDACCIVFDHEGTGAHATGDPHEAVAAMRRQLLPTTEATRSASEPEADCEAYDDGHRFTRRDGRCECGASQSQPAPAAPDGEVKARARMLPKRARILVSRFEVKSCADGTLKVIPRWTCGSFDDDGNLLPPGLPSRMLVAAEVERALNRCLGILEATGK